MNHRSNQLHWYSHRARAGFTLPELLVIIVIIGVIGAVGIQGFFFLVRRARVQSVALEAAGWLEQVRNAAADEVRANSAQGGCEVRFDIGDRSAGQRLAFADENCPIPDQEPTDELRTLNVPPEVQQDSVNLAVSGSNPFAFTPRGIWIDPGSDPPGSLGQEFVLTIRLNNDLPVRCVRLSPTLGSVQIGRPPNSASSNCENWQTL